MLPVRTDAANAVYNAPPGQEDEVGNLPVHRDGNGAVTSWWTATDNDAGLLPDGLLVALTILGEPIPPVALALVGMDGQPHTHERPASRVLGPNGEAIAGDALAPMLENAKARITAAAAVLGELGLLMAARDYDVATEGLYAAELERGIARLSLALNGQPGA